MKAEMDIQQQKMEATIHSIRSELKETIKHRVEDVLSCVEQKMQGIRKELTKKIDETQVDLTDSKDVHQYMDRESQGRYNGHKEGLSQGHREYKE
jgi:hypothetical protein